MEHCTFSDPRIRMQLLTRKEGAVGENLCSHGPGLCLPADKEMQIQSILQLDCCHTNVTAARDSSPLPTLHSARRPLSLQRHSLH